MGVALELRSGERLDFEEHVRECLNCLQQTISGNLDFENTASECLKGSEEAAIGNWRKGDLCYTVAKNLVALSSAVIWKAECV